MRTPRDGHTATLLDDGRVLVSGGFLGGDSLESTASAELYDPARDRWSEAAPMLHPRARHTATLLPDGKVLVVGGISPISEGGQLTDVAEVYDPRLDLWSALPGQAPAREGQSAVLLASGSVFIVGGQANGAAPEDGASLYLPGSNVWFMLQIGTPRFGQTATLLPHDNVLVLGGFGPEVLPPGPDLLSTGELHQPNEGTWTAIAEMPDVRAGHSATRLESGRVLVVGGAYLDDRAILYDPAADSWSMTGPPQRRYGHTATLLRDGRVLIAGGYGALTSAVLYDPAGGAPVDPATSWLLALVLPVAILVSVLALPLRRSAPRLVAALRAARDPDRWIE
jgi:N-acetylneuraminic acid mutarotase